MKESTSVGNFLQMRKTSDHIKSHIKCSRVRYVIDKKVGQQKEIMWNVSALSCFFVCWSCFILTPEAYADRVNKTCLTCAEMSKTFSYNVCSTSLGAVPASHVTDLQGLALIAMELAIQNASASIATIKQLQCSGSFDSYGLTRLNDCLELYTGGAVMLMSSTGAFLSGNYADVNVWVSSVMDAATTCEDGFIEKEGLVSPLKEENYYLLQLCDIVICIINLLSLHVNS